jgi:hypothetical protein
MCVILGLRNPGLLNFDFFFGGGGGGVYSLAEIGKKALGRNNLKTLWFINEHFY